MPSSPNQLPSGKQYELRLAASDPEFDGLLSELTLPITRPSLPGYLHLYSDRQFILNTDDRDIDGKSFRETQFRGFRMRVTNHNRDRFSLSPQAEKVRMLTGDKGLRVNLQLNLGVQAASELMVSPFFTSQERNEGKIPFHYTIPDPVHARTMESAYSQIEKYLASKPRGIVDELMIVESAFRDRKMRDRIRQDKKPAEPVPITAATPVAPPIIGDDFIESAG